MLFRNHIPYLFHSALKLCTDVFCSHVSRLHLSDRKRFWAEEWDILDTDIAHKSLTVCFSCGTCICLETNWPILIGFCSKTSMKAAAALSTITHITLFCKCRKPFDLYGQNPVNIPCIRKSAHTHMYTYIGSISFQGAQNIIRTKVGGDWDSGGSVPDHGSSTTHVSV